MFRPPRKCVCTVTSFFLYNDAQVFNSTQFTSAPPPPSHPDVTPPCELHFSSGFKLHTWTFINCTLAPSSAPQPSTTTRMQWGTVPWAWTRFRSIAAPFHLLGKFQCLLLIVQVRKHTDDTEMNKNAQYSYFTNSFFLVSRQRANSGGRVLAVIPPSPVMRHSSDPHLSPSTANNPPEHPVHTSHSAHSSPAHHPSFQSQSSETAGSYCDLRPCPAGPPKPPTKGYVERLRVEEGTEVGAREEGDGMFCTPQVEKASSFRPSKYVLGFL